MKTAEKVKVVFVEIQLELLWKCHAKGKSMWLHFANPQHLQRRHLCKTVKSHSGAKSLIYFYIEYITFTIIWSTFKLDVTFSILRFWTWFFVVVERGGEEGYHDYFFFLFFSFDLVNFFVKCTHVLMRVPSNVVYFFKKYLILNRYRNSRRPVVSGKDNLEISEVRWSNF